MAEPRAADAWLFHAGALGDFVLVWPLIRALARGHTRVHVVADASKAALAASCIAANVVAHDSQRHSFTRLWTGEPAVPSERITDAALVVNFISDPASHPAWTVAARTLFPGAALRYVGAPASESRRRAWRELNVEQWGAPLAPHLTVTGPVGGRAPVDARTDSRPGPILCHVGAGAAAKRWHMANWRRLADLLPAESAFLAGEVEAAQFTTAERSLFHALHGHTCTSLEELARIIRAAPAFIGADTGPTHLAAQLGVPTLALFGPTDPEIWSPIGPCVRVVAPPHPSPMTWLTPEKVRDEHAGLA